MRRERVSMRKITLAGFIGADWIKRHPIVSGEQYTVNDGAIDVDGAKFVFVNPDEAFPDGMKVAVHIFYRRRLNNCQTLEEYEKMMAIVERGMREQEEEEGWYENQDVRSEDNL